jgi:hypothetical protein
MNYFPGSHYKDIKDIMFGNTTTMSGVFASTPKFCIHSIKVYETT